MISMTTDLRLSTSRDDNPDEDDADGLPQNPDLGSPRSFGSAWEDADDPNRPYGEDVDFEEELDVLDEQNLFSRKNETVQRGKFERCRKVKNMQKFQAFLTMGQRRNEVNLEDLDPELRKGMEAEIQAELKRWLDSKSATLIGNDEVPVGKQKLRSRLVLTIKETYKNGVLIGRKPKARLVVLGFEDWRAINEGLETDAPTVNRVSSRVVTVIVLANKWDTYSGDVSMAFLRGDDLPEPLFADVPGVCKVAGQKAFRIIRGVFGLLDAPRLWYKRCRRDLEKLGAKVCPLDPCVFLWFDPEEKPEADEELWGILLARVNAASLWCKWGSGGDGSRCPGG